MGRVFLSAKVGLRIRVWASTEIGDRNFSIMQDSAVASLDSAVASWQCAARAIEKPRLGSRYGVVK